MADAITSYLYKMWQGFLYGSTTIKSWTKSIRARRIPPVKYVGSHATRRPRRTYPASTSTAGTPSSRQKYRVSARIYDLVDRKGVIRWFRGRILPRIRRINIIRGSYRTRETRNLGARHESTERLESEIIGRRNSHTRNNADRRVNSRDVSQRIRALELVRARIDKDRITHLE